MDALDKLYAKRMLQVLNEMENTSEDDMLDMSMGLETARSKGMEWLEGHTPDRIHENVTFPLYALATSFVGKIVGPSGREAVGLYTMASAVIEIAVQKGYEKGKREAMASLVLSSPGEEESG